MATDKKIKYTTPEVWAERAKLATGQQTKLFKRFANWYDSLYTVMGTVPAPWRSKVYVPIMARQTWALVSKFLALKPGFQVRVATPEQKPETPGEAPDPDDGELPGLDDVDEKAEKAQRKLEFDFENPYLDNTMRDKLFAPLLDAVVTGTGLAKVKWVVKDKSNYERIIDDSGNVDLSQEKKTTKKVSYNDLEPVNIFNVLVSPAAIDLYNAPWIIIKEKKTMEELKAAGIYKNLDQLSGNESLDDDFTGYNFSRNRLTSSQNRRDDTIERIKIYECYEGDKIQTFAESQSSQNAGGTGTEKEGGNWVPLLERKNPYWFGKYPLVKFHVKKRPFDFWGEGIYETTFRLQSAYNDVYNHFLDQWNLSENSMLMVKENSNVNDYIVEPGGTITYRGDQPPTQFKHAAPDPRAMETILTYLDQAVEGVTISQYASGQANSATDKTKGTATGIVKLQEAAGDVISFMRQNFTQSIVQIGRMWLSNNQQFMDQPVNIVATVNGKKKPMTITPQDMQGDMELIIDDSTMDPAAQDEKVQREMVFLQELQQLQKSSIEQAQITRWTTSPLYLNFANIFQDYAQTMGRSQADKYILGEDIVKQAVSAAQTPFILPNEKWQIDLNQLYGSEAAQLLQRSGIQPDGARAQEQPVQGDVYQAKQTGPGGMPADNQAAVQGAPAAPGAMNMPSPMGTQQPQQPQQAGPSQAPSEGPGSVPPGQPNPTQVTPDHMLAVTQAEAAHQQVTAMNSHKQQMAASKLAHEQQMKEAQLQLQAHDQQFKQMQQQAETLARLNAPKENPVKKAVNKIRGK